MAEELKSNDVSRIRALLALKEEVTEIVEEREDALDAIIMAVLSGMHCFLYGSPGTAKSLSGRLFFNAIEDCNKLMKQLTRQMTEEGVFGPLRINKWKTQEVYEYNTKGGLAEADLALLEEYFDASDGCIRSMNEVLNERIFTRAVGQITKCPLHSVIATSNFWRDKDDAQAVADRFLCRVTVNPLVEEESRVSMIRKFLSDTKPNAKTKMPFADIKKLYQLRSKVEVDPDIIRAYSEVAKHVQAGLGKKGFMSDRRITWGSLLLQAAAIKNERMEAEMEDIKQTRYALIFVGDSEQDEIFETAYNKVVGELEVRGKFKRDLIKLRAALEKGRATLKDSATDQESLVRTHDLFQRIRSGLKDRKPSNDQSLERQFEGVEKELETLVADISKAIRPKNAKSVI